MTWDLNVIRRYSTTNHPRLLQQLKRELQDQPIQRPEVSPKATTQEAAVVSFGPPAHAKRKPYVYRPLNQRTTGGAVSVPRSAAAARSAKLPAAVASPNTSFRERLQAVEVR
jgi:hypothetical protein